MNHDRRPPHRRRHRLLRRAAAALALALAAAILAACGASQASDAAADAAAEPPRAAERPRAVAVVTQAAEAREVVDTAHLPGELAPLRRAVLAAEVAGRVEALAIDAGDRVAAGAPLVTVDAETWRQRVAEAEAVDRYRRAQLDRAEKLLARHAITQQQFLDATTQHDVAAAQLATARLTLARARVEAPWAGTVAERHVEVGDYVTPGQPVITLVDLRRLEVRATARAADVPYLRPGLPAEVTVDAFPGEVFRGTVARVAAELDPAARTLGVEIEIDNRERRLKPGLAARAAIPRRTLPGAILVPLAALVELERTKVVYVVEDGHAVQRPVVLGPLLGEQAVITDGLAAGERVVVDGQQRLSPGQPVVEAEG